MKLLENNSKALRKSLVEAGFSEPTIEAAWPDWWSEKANSSSSAQAELRFSLARKLGLSSSSLLGDKVEFVWRNSTRFKSLSAESEHELAPLASFASSIGHLLVQATGTPTSGTMAGIRASDLRGAILASRHFVDLVGLLGACWALGVPVGHLALFPNRKKNMHATAVGIQGRYAVLLARNSQYPAPTAFTLAHELGHIALGHLDKGQTIIELADPAHHQSLDKEELEANAFALELLTGSQEPDIDYNISEFNSTELADAAMKAAALYQIEPGTLALIAGHRSGRWLQAQASLKQIYSIAKPIGAEVNALAFAELDWSSLPADMATFLAKVLNVAIE